VSIVDQHIEFAEKILAEDTAKKVEIDGMGILEVKHEYLLIGDGMGALLADVLMPLMNCVELAIAIARMLPATKILLFSGQVGISDILRQGEEEGYVFDLVAKPIHPEKLVEHLKRKK
jgi:CheY-like chemotaxis protein